MDTRHAELSSLTMYRHSSEGTCSHDGVSARLVLDMN